MRNSLLFAILAFPLAAELNLHRIHVKIIGVNESFTPLWKQLNNDSLSSLADAIRGKVRTP